MAYAVTDTSPPFYTGSALCSHGPRVRATLEKCGNIGPWAHRSVGSFLHQTNSMQSIPLQTAVHTTHTGTADVAQCKWTKAVQ